MKTWGVCCTFLHVVDAETAEEAEEMTREYDKTPVITMSMGAKGVISRVSGLLFGSAVTFAAVGKTSAPGQLEVEEVRKIMRILR